MFAIGQRITDTRNNEACIIENIITNSRGSTLYTVQYSNRYRRYYSTKFNSIFISSGATATEVEAIKEDLNVVFINFKTGERLIDRDAWLYSNHIAKRRA